VTLITESPEEAVMSRRTAAASFATCLLLVEIPSASRFMAPKSLPPPSMREKGCAVQYEGGRELYQVNDARIQELFRDLLARAGITETVLLCADIPLAETNFAETVRRSDGRAIVAISLTLASFSDDEVSGILAHELAHLLAGSPGRSRPASLNEYLREEHEADLEAARLVGPGAVCASVRRAYQTSVVLGFESDDHALRKYRDQRLTWIRSVPANAGEHARCRRLCGP
jgi:hypothetical protein